MNVRHVLDSLNLDQIQAELPEQWRAYVFRECGLNFLLLNVVKAQRKGTMPSLIPLNRVQNDI